MDTKCLLEFSGEFVKSGVSAMIEDLIGGAEGLVLSTLSEQSLQFIINKLGEKIDKRNLSRGDKYKVGTTMYYAINKINEKIENNMSFINNSFFKEDEYGRFTADEILEGILFSAQKEHEEKKLKYYGYLFANMAFDRFITREDANQFVYIAENLSYRHLKLLRLFTLDDEVINLRNVNYLDYCELEPDLLYLLYDLFELYNKGLLRNKDDSYISNIKEIIPSKLKTYGIGVVFNIHMELDQIPDNELSELINILKRRN